MNKEEIKKLSYQLEIVRAIQHTALANKFKLSDLNAYIEVLKCDIKLKIKKLNK